MPKKINPRVVIPPQVPKLLSLAQLIWNKHEADGSASELNILPDVDWAALHPLIAQAEALHAEAHALKLQAEEKTAARNILVKQLAAGTRRTGGYLKSLHADNPHALGDWGFEVNTSKRKQAPKKGKETGE